MPQEHEPSQLVNWQDCRRAGAPRGGVRSSCSALTRTQQRQLAGFAEQLGGDSGRAKSAQHMLADLMNSVTRSEQLVSYADTAENANSAQIVEIALVQCMPTITRDAESACAASSLRKPMDNRGASVCRDGWLSHRERKDKEVIESVTILPDIFQLLLLRAEEDLAQVRPAVCCYAEADPALNITCTSTPRRWHKSMLHVLHPSSHSCSS